MRNCNLLHRDLYATVMIMVVAHVRWPLRLFRFQSGLTPSN